MDTVKLMRRHFSLVSSCPANLDAQSVAAHVISKDLCDTFEVAMICLFLECVVKPGYMYKYTPRSGRPELIDTSPPSLLREVVTLGQPIRLNNLAEFTYDPTIDGVSGIKAHRVFCMPLTDRVTGRVFGAINLINKRENDIFTNGDEIFIRIFAIQLEVMLSCCTVQKKVTSKAQLLQHLLRASVDFESTIPPKGTLVAHRPILIGACVVFILLCHLLSCL